MSMRLVLSVVGILITFAIGMLFYAQWLAFEEKDEYYETTTGAPVPSTSLDAIDDALEVKDLIENR